VCTPLSGIADYRDNLDWSSAPAIQEMPVVSAICEPTQQQVFSKYEGEITLKGYAWSGGGKDIVRVDVSSDGEQYYRDSVTDWCSLGCAVLQHIPSCVQSWVQNGLELVCTQSADIKG
jgi:hypothetical protein